MPDIFTSPTKPKVKVEKGSLKTQTGGALSQFLFMPTGIRFETQEHGESIILFLRKHWVTNVPWILTAFLLIIAPSIIFPFFLSGNIVPVEIQNSFISLIILIWYLFSFSFIFVNFLLWYFTVSIVTNERVIDIDFINILNKKFAETRINRIEDVTQRSGGFLMAFFDYGNVIVQTAAAEQSFQFQLVPYPQQVVRIINQLMGKEEEV